MAIRAFVSLLPLISQEVRLIGDLNNFFNFDHNIVVLEASANIDHFINRDANYPQSIYVFDGSHGNIKGLESLTKIKSKNTFMIVVPESSTFDSNLNLLNCIKGIHRLDTDMKIGMFLPQSTSMEDLQKLFQWCKKHLIVHIFVATYSHTTAANKPYAEHFVKIFTFHPFGRFHVINAMINLTNSGTYNQCFPSLNFNFYQEKL